MVGRRPLAAFGNSTGDRQMLEYTKVGAFTQTLYHEAREQGWIVISIMNDWKRIFDFER